MLVNSSLSDEVTEILIGLRDHMNITFKQPPSSDGKKATLDFLTKRLRTGDKAVPEITRVTHSTLKFNAIPLFTPQGKTVTIAHCKAAFSLHPEWKDVEFLKPPRFVLPTGVKDPLTATLQVKVLDVRKATNARALLNTSVSFAGALRRCREWKNTTLVRQCSNCLKWGHSAFVCRSDPACAACSMPHPTELHGIHRQKCSDPTCPHSHTRCNNCFEDHRATDTTWAFFRQRASPSRMKQLNLKRYHNVQAQRNAKRASRGKPAHPPHQQQMG